MNFLFIFVPVILKNKIMKTIKLNFFKRNHDSHEHLEMDRLSIYDGFTEAYDSSVDNARIIQQKTFSNFNLK